MARSENRDAPITHAIEKTILGQTCPVCEQDAVTCACPPDEGGEKPCLHCGTTGWDCLDLLNRDNGQHCCGWCPFIAGHQRPKAASA